MSDPQKMKLWVWVKKHYLLSIQQNHSNRKGENITIKSQSTWPLTEDPAKSTLYRDGALFI